MTSAYSPASGDSNFTLVPPVYKDALLSQLARIAQGLNFLQAGDADIRAHLQFAAEFFAKKFARAGVVAAPGDDHFQFIRKRRRRRGDHQKIDDVIDPLERSLDGGGVDGCALDLHRLVFAPQDRPDARRPESAGTALARHERDVAGGEANQRHRLDADG